MRQRTAAAMQRDAEAYASHLAGLTYQQIADRHGWQTRGAALKAVRRAIADTYRLPHAEAVTVEQDRLDMLTRIFTDLAAEQGQDPHTVIAAGLAVLRVSESRRKLLGLDAPAQRRVEVITEDMVDAEIRRLEDRVGKLSGRASAAGRQAD
jgi:uncharacterized protein (DUF2267 family)